MSGDPVFVDTWGWCALGHRADPVHAKAVEFYRGLRQQRTPIFTSDYVLDTDLTSMVIMQDRHIGRVFTADVHFSQVGLGFSLAP